MATNSGDWHEPQGSLSAANKLRVLFLGSEWGSSNGGLSTINRVLAAHAAKHSKVDVSFLVPRCSDRDKLAANAHNIDLREAQRIPGMKELLWLTSPPPDLHFDIVVGHGRMLGPQAQVITTNSGCKWVQFVHTAPEELGMHKEYPNPILRGERKHKTEVELCENANLVVTIGSKLNNLFRSYLSSCKTDDLPMTTVPVKSSGVNQFLSGGLCGGGKDEKCIVCACGHPAKRFTVKKETRNKGRQFYSCPNYNSNNGCEFFLWADDSERHASSSFSHTTPQTPSNNINRNRAGFNAGQNLPSPGVSGSMKAQTSSPFCLCNQPAASHTVSKDGPNKGLPFYCCAKPIGQGCGFFKWGDTPGLSAGASNRFKRQASASNGGVKKKRKCGLCHQEGHTKRSCITRR